MHDHTYTQFVLDQLFHLGRVRAKKMFGGYGLYMGDTFFGIIHRSTLFFKTDERTCRDYENEGMGPFRPNEKQTLTSYYQVPPILLDDHEELARWASKAIRIAGGMGT